MADKFTLNEEGPTMQHPSQPPNPSQPPSAAPELLTPAQQAQQSIFVAVESHFVAQRARAIANINGYIHSPAGVAEHPDVVEEVIKLLSAIDEADGKLATLQRITNPK